MQKVVAEIALQNNIWLQIVHGDITEEDTDAIVNAANEQLQHGGGVAGAIARKGGPVIQEESNSLGHVPTGSAGVTSAGTLMASFVIHAVGPVWHGGTEHEEELLASAVRSSLEVASKLQLESIALPAISSGIYGFPKPRCAEIIVDAIRRFASSGSTSLRTVRCTNIDVETVQEFRKIVDSLTD